MQKIKKLTIEDAQTFKKDIIHFIYDSVKNSAHEDSYSMSDAECKYAEMVEYMKVDKALVCGATIGNSLCGFIWGYEFPFRDDKQRLYVSILHVEEKFRNQNLGMLLLEYIEKQAKVLGYHAVFLHTEAFNKGAIRFYERMGYELERVQLVKRTFVKTKNADNAKGGRLLTDRDILKNKEILIYLFMLNTKAHILTECFDSRWVEKKIMDLPKYISEGKAVVLGCFDREDLVGFMWVFPYTYKKEPRWMLNAITVLPQYRKKGVAGKMFMQMERLLASTEKILYTYVDVANEAAWRFYIAQGMEEEEFQMVKELS